MTSRLFRFVQEVHADQPWGAVLDAGTGVNSATWIAALPTERWTAVSAAPAHADQVRDALGERIRAQDRIVVGNWIDDAFLRGEQFDTVVADYLLGAVEGFAPYFQQHLFARLRAHVRSRIYVVGLDPYVVGRPATDDGAVVQAIGQLRDACLWLAGESPYREFPAEWAANSLKLAGFKIDAAERFPIRYKQSWIDSQLNMALQRLERLPERPLADSLRDRIEALRDRAAALCEAKGGLRHGFDYVIAASPA